MKIIHICLEAMLVHQVWFMYSAENDRMQEKQANIIFKALGTVFKCIFNMLQSPLMVLQYLYTKRVMNLRFRSSFSDSSNSLISI